ncbi:MAG TPA: alpha/beta fold hydrolase [Chthonomonadales bacterium]|nr:alpha/beta fold hydrolase [Chthonomonadales bacterium]
MRLTRVTIPSATASLSALLYEPVAPRVRACVTLAHGYTASKESLDLLAAYLCRKGFGCLTFDFRGHKLGGSGAMMESPADACDDLQAAATHTMAHFGQRSLLLVGHSLGALASLAVAEQLGAVAGVAAIAAGMRPSSGFDSKAGRALHEQRSDYVAGAPTEQFLAVLDGLAASVRRPQGLPALFVAARRDAFVHPASVRELAERTGGLHRYAEIDAGHADAPTKAGGVVARWALSVAR